MLFWAYMQGRKGTHVEGYAVQHTLAMMMSLSSMLSSTGMVAPLMYQPAVDACASTVSGILLLNVDGG